MQIDTDLNRIDASCDIRLKERDIDRLLCGESLSDQDRGLDVTISIDFNKQKKSSGESPLDYLERTWNEPRYGETPIQHFNRIHGVSE